LPALGAPNRTMFLMCFSSKTCIGERFSGTKEN
jgi:hypothetical protein